MSAYRINGLPDSAEPLFSANLGSAGFEMVGIFIEGIDRFDLVTAATGVSSGTT